MRLTEHVHHALKNSVHAGSTVIDATAGNGYDSLLLAQLVGPKGRLIAIDIQPAAIESTKSRLETADLADRCELIRGDHSMVLRQLAQEHAGAIAAITFNLGYLPGGDKSLITSPATTLAALDAACELLARDGILSVTAYRGHAGGMAESEQIGSWMHRLPKSTWRVETQEPDPKGRKSIPPILWIAQKRSMRMSPTSVKLSNGMGIRFSSLHPTRLRPRRAAC
jgi:predicted methyltransferase